MTKKIKLLALALLAFVSVSVSAGNDKPITVKQLPAKAQQMIKTNFGKQQVAYATMDRDGFSKSYDVGFSNGMRLEFDASGNWTEIDCGGNAVPNTFVPTAIRNAAKKNFPNARIVKIEKDRKGYDIELSNGMEMKFNKNLRLLEIDD